MQKTINNKILKLYDLDTVLATRDIARFVVKIALDQKYDTISFKNVISCSRSFLDELYVLSQNKQIELVNIPESVSPLLKIIERSHKSQKVFAPKIKVRISNTTFA